MSKFNENDMANKPPEKEILELAVFKIFGNVFFSNLEEWKNSRTANVNMSAKALIMRGTDLATLQAYDV